MQPPVPASRSAATRLALVEMSALWLRTALLVSAAHAPAPEPALVQTLMALAAAEAREEAKPPCVPWVLMLVTRLELEEAQPDARACMREDKGGCVGQDTSLCALRAHHPSLSPMQLSTRAVLNLELYERNWLRNSHHTGSVQPTDHQSSQAAAVPRGEAAEADPAGRHAGLRRHCADEVLRC